MPIELENDPTNPCFGCGPANAAGMRLRFFHEGDAVRSSFVAEERFQGFPGTLHSAFLYLALVEVMNWTVWATLGRAGLPARTGALETLGRVATGARVDLAARMTGPRSARAEASVDGKVVASIARDYDLPTREEFARRLPAAAAHGSLEGAFPE